MFTDPEIHGQLMPVPVGAELLVDGLYCRRVRFHGLHTNTTVNMH